MVEGKTPEITIEQARTLLGVRSDRPADTSVGLRDRAILAMLVYTACRVGAVAKLRLGDFQHDGTQYVLRFPEKGGKSREIPVRHDLEGFSWPMSMRRASTARPKDRRCSGRRNRRTKKLTAGPHDRERICRLMKRRLKDAGLPSRLSPHSFRVTAMTDLLEQGVPLEDVQYLAGHADPRTTRIYDRRQKGDAEHRRADLDLTLCI